MNMKGLIIPLAVIIFLFGISCSASKSVSNLEPAEVSDIVENQNFTFVAERVSPISGRLRTLTSRYDVQVTRDSLISYLPYFGRSYSAPVNPGQVSTQFTSTNFTYEVSAGKKGVWNIKINPKDAPEIQELIFSIFENGSASLHLLSTSKSAITYSGYIQKRE